MKLASTLLLNVTPKTCVVPSKLSIHLSIRAFVGVTMSCALTSFQVGHRGAMVR